MIRGEATNHSSHDLKALRESFAARQPDTDEPSIEASDILEKCESWLEIFKENMLPPHRDGRIPRRARTMCTIKGKATKVCLRWHSAKAMWMTVTLEEGIVHDDLSADSPCPCPPQGI